MYIKRKQIRKSKHEGRNLELLGPFILRKTAPDKTNTKLFLSAL
jgi:hypothetical protein